MSFVMGLQTISTVLFLLSNLSQATNVVRGKYIMEFADTTTGDVDAFYKTLANAGIPATHCTEFKYELFKGLSFQLDGDDGDDIIAKINSMDTVKSTWPVRALDRPVTTLTTLSGPNSNEAPLKKRQETTTPQENTTLDENYPHRMGSVDKLHAEGYTGEGIFIGIIDTGVDYTHSALGGCFGPGCKVIAGYDLVGDDYNGFNTPVPDDDPMDVMGHGTHVSGIIAADPNHFNFTGVVPDAKLGMWKVFGRTGQVQDDVMIHAFNMAYEAGVDIISVSIGGPGGWSDVAYNVAVQRITEKGVVFTIAAGNNGTSGLFMASTPADSVGAIAVGSVDNIYTPKLLLLATYNIGGGVNTTTNSTATEFEYAAPRQGDYGTVSVPVYATSLDATTTTDACQPLPADTPDLSPYLVLIKRGGCIFQTKVNNAVAAGAKIVMIYNNVDSDPITPGVTGTPAGMIRRSLGEQWVAALKAGSNVTVNLVSLAVAGQSLDSVENTITGGFMSTYSSWGPTYDGWVKPEVSSPGGQILSTYLNNSYAVFDGTSMACPYVAGVVGLIKQVRGRNTLNPFQIASLLETTATPLNFNNGNATSNFLTPVAQQGGGLVNAYTAAYTKSLLDLDNIPLNDTQFFKSDHSVTITNLGDEEQTYSFDSLTAATAYTLSSGSISPATFPAKLELDPSPAAGVSANFLPATLTIPAKSNGVVTIQFTPPSGLDASRIPLFSGFITINGSLGDSLTLPYAGVGTNLSSVQLMDIENGYPWLAASALTEIATTPHVEPVLPNNTAISGSYVFSLPSNANTTSTGLNQSEIIYPTIVFNMAMGTRLLRVDVIPEDTTSLQMVLGEPAMEIKVIPIISVPVPGVAARNTEAWAQWDGMLADGSKALAGKYKFLTRALKIFGDETDGASYERYESVEFEIKYV